MCFWEDDSDDFREPDRGHHGPNYGVSLDQAREDFRAFDAASREHIPSVRAPLPQERPPDIAHAS